MGIKDLPNLKMKQGSRHSIGVFVIFLAVSFIPGLFGSMFKPDAW
jgi:hypothetical protein